MNSELEQSRKNTFLSKKIQCRTQTFACIVIGVCIHVYGNKLIHDLTLLHGAMCSVRSLSILPYAIASVYLKYLFFI